MAAPLNDRNKVLAMQLEGTAGTAETGLDADDAKILTFDAKIEPTIEIAERMPDSPNGGPMAGTPGQYTGRATFSLELRGKGASGVPKWTDLLKCAGFAAGTGQVFSLSNATASKNTCTMQVYNDGLRRQLHGAMCSRLSLSGQPGRKWMAEFEFMGIYTIASDVAILSPTHETPLPPRWANAAFTWGSETPKVSQVSIDIGLQTTMRDDNAPVSGVMHAWITGYNPRITMDPETQLVAADDIDTELLAGSTRALSLAIGTASNNTITIAAPVTQIQSKSPANRNGILVDNIELLACEGSGSPLTITFA